MYIRPSGGLLGECMCVCALNLLFYFFILLCRAAHSRSKKILIPAALISRVIGRGGCNVNAIREYTGAHIDIDTNRKKANGDCIVTIKYVIYLLIYV